MATEPTRPEGLPLSVYLAVRRRHPTLPAVRVRKRTLSALSHALEEEIAERCDHPVLFGGFQQVQHLTTPLTRWQDLARRARSVIVFVEEPAAGAPAPDTGLRVVPTPTDAPVRWEWIVVAADPGFGVALVAWEIPGQESVRDGDRVFELVWSLEPDPVDVAARTCARIAAHAGLPEATELVPAAPARDVDLRTASEVFSRVLARVDAARPA